jgi:hypothetical protein
MKTYDNFETFWGVFFKDEPKNHGFDTWTIAKFIHTSDQEYATMRGANLDTLGFQPTLLTLADPIHQRRHNAMIKNISSSQFQKLKRQYQERFIDQLTNRFGWFHTAKKQADAIYDNWEDFSREWLQRDDQDILSYNLPLLFDHVSNAEYWAQKQKGFDPYKKQCLIVTIFQYRVDRFADVFITDVTDADMDRIKLLIQSKLKLRMQDLF